MKLTRINDNQIKVVLTRQDLAARNIKLSEFAYGSAKAKDLFNELVIKANAELDFNVENDAPLMVEAIPMGAGEVSLMLLISKMEYPEELDTKYSDFTDCEEYVSPFDGDGDSSEGSSGGFFDRLKAAASALGLSDLTSLEGASNSQNNNSSAGCESDSDEIEAISDLTRLFAFDNLDDVIRLARTVGVYYTGVSSLYRDSDEDVYYLVVHSEGSSAGEFNKACNMLSEYSLQLRYLQSEEAFFKEHFQQVRARDAISFLCASALIREENSIKSKK